MEDSFDVTIMESGLASWLAALVLADQGMSVALLLGRAPDPGLPPFHSLPMDPSRSAALLAPFRIRPAGFSTKPFIPDLQVIVSGRPVDLNVHPDHREACLVRDLGETAELFEQISQQLDERAKKLVSGAMEAGFPPPGAFGRGKPSLLKLAARAGRSGSGAFKPEASPPFSELAKEADPALRAVFLAACSAVAGVPLTGEESAGRVALLWRFCYGLHTEGGAYTDFREQAAARISERRGEILEGALRKVEMKGSSIKSIEFGERTLRTRALIAPGAVLRSLPLQGRRKKGVSRKKSASRTFFFRVDKSTLPESLAMRVVVVRDPHRELKRDNLILLARSPRAPRRDTLCVTVVSPQSALSVKAVPGMLAASLPWLDPARLQIDEMREEEVAHHFCPAPTLTAPREYDTGIDNAMPPASEVLAEWGPMGLVPGVKAQSDILRRRLG